MTEYSIWRCRATYASYDFSYCGGAKDAYTKSAANKVMTKNYSTKNAQHIK